MGNLFCSKEDRVEEQNKKLTELAYKVEKLEYQLDQQTQKINEIIHVIKTPNTSSWDTLIINPLV